MCKRIVKFVVSLVCFSLIGAGMVLAQVGSGQITGTVTDPTGAVIPGAMISVTAEATGVKLSTTTNSSGFYLVGGLGVGYYTIEARAKGFQAYIDRHVQLTVGQSLGVNVMLKVGNAQTQSVTVEGVAPIVNTTQGRLSHLVTSSQIEQIPLNGRDIYQLMQLVPGAVASMSVDFEATEGANVNGTRGNFNGFLMNGGVDKGLSGGANAHPAPDFVNEYRIQTDNFSAQYSGSAGSETDVSTKSGTNQWHGDAYEFFRNTALNAGDFFSNAAALPKPEWRQNQFGGTIGGPIKKDKLFVFGGIEGSQFRTASPFTFLTETPFFHSTVESLFPNSAAALLYKNFPGPTPTTGLQTASDVINTSPDFGGTGNTFYTDPCALYSLGMGQPSYPGGPNWGNPQQVANNMAQLIGVSTADNAAATTDINANCPGMFTAPAVQGGALGNAPIVGSATAGGLSYVSGIFYTGYQYTFRMDYAQSNKSRMFGAYYWYYEHNINGSPSTGIRGFTSPSTDSFPDAQFGWTYTVSPTMVNDLLLSWTRNQSGIQPTASQFGVPDIGFDTGEVQFGAYNGYPQYFNEDRFRIQDMVTWVKGNHTIKTGFSGTANYENSEFNVGRPSFYFFDPLYFATDTPYWEAGGVNPQFTALGGTGSSSLDDNIRAWRNKEYGAFIQDDWKVKKNLTLNLGLRWDYFSPHTEKYNKATAFVLGPGTSPASRLASVNCQAFIGTSCIAPAGDTNSPTGGFTRVHSLWPGRWNDFGPRVGFAWDPWGTGKNSLRGGAGIEYEGSFYNALSNSRWNMPFYSFNIACPLCGYAALPTYGPTTASGTPDTGVAPSYTGSPTQPGAIGNGPGGLGFQGNLMGWYPGNPNLAYLTGIPSPDYKLPYYEDFFLGVQHELSPSTVLEVDGVSTLGHHLFWAEDPNRVINGLSRNPSTVMNPCTGTAVAAPTALINPCFGTMRTWETSANSSYFALQVSLRRDFARGLAYTSNYTWSHSLDIRSTWHALTGGGSATDSNPFGEAGYSMDPNAIYLERGNSLFDATQRWVSTVMWDLPWMKNQSTLAGKVLGGWEASGDISLQSGFPFTVGAKKDYSLDGLPGQRPNTPSFGNRYPWTAKDWEFGANGANPMYNMASAFPAPTPGTVGNLGRNTFRGPGIADTDLGLFKRIPLGSNESRYLQFRAEFFNLFNHTILNPPQADLSSGLFGQSTSTNIPSREVQFALKLFF